MAKRTGPNKSQAIREEMKAQPNATASEIAKAVSEKIGEEVNPRLVYNIKSSEGKSSTKKKASKKKATTAAAPKAQAASVSSGMNVNLVKQAAALLSHAGDAKAAREALDAASEISKALNK